MLQQITVEFNTGTLGKVQLEPGTIATPYEMQIYSDQLAQCQRYYQDPANGGGSQSFQSAFYLNVSAAVALQSISFPIMRATPTVTTRNINYNNASALTVSGLSPASVSVSFTVSSAGAAWTLFNLGLSSEL
jgi:hypothetical protein